MLLWSKIFKAGTEDSNQIGVDHEGQSYFWGVSGRVTPDRN
jgi:hypothetical protein